MTTRAFGHPPGEVLSAAVDAELDPAELDWVHGHVADCPACALELSTLSAIRAAVRALPPPVLPAGYEDDLVRWVRRQESVSIRDAASPGPENGSDRALLLHLRRRVAATAAAVAAVAAAVVISVAPRETRATPRVGRMVEFHITSTGGGDPSRLAPAAVPASVGK